MSSEQQERMAVQYAERSLLFTVKSLLKILEWSRRQALAQDSAYKIRKRRDSFSHRLARGFSTFLHERPFDSGQSFRPSVRKNG